MKNTQLSNRRIAQTAASAAILATASTGQAARMSEKEFLAGLQDEKADTRYVTWIQADAMRPQVVSELGKLLDSSNPGIAKAAGEALRIHVHGAAKEWDGSKRKAVMNALLKLTGGGNPKKTRIAAIRHLSTVGDAEAVPPVAELIQDKSLQEEAVFCLERIPGEESIRALIDSLAKADKAFKPRIFAALGHRKAEAAVDVLARAMGDMDTKIAIPAMKATARVGIRPEIDVQLPDFESLSDLDKRAFVDSFVRYMEAQTGQGNWEDSEGFYVNLLDNTEEEHYRCAAIIGLGKIGSSTAISAILLELNGENSTVRRIARKALIAMKGSSVEPKLKDALQNAEGDKKKTLEEILKARK